MPSLRCEFADKLRFYEQVLGREDHRLFVATEDDLPIGQLIDLEVVLGSDPTALQGRAKVIGKRTRTGATPGGQSGAWVQLDAESRETLKSQMKIEEADSARISARSYPRFERQLSVAIDKPVNRTLQTHDISLGGIRVEGLVGAPVGQTVRMSVDLGGQNATVYGRVAWQREDVRQTGIEFRFPNDSARTQVLDYVSRVATESDWLVFGRPTVLLVDDEPSTLRAIERVLNTRGFATLTARSGPEALVIAREQQPALILLDLLMPGMNGVEVVRILKRDVETSRIPLVLTSAMEPTGLALMLDEAKALAALRKPYRAEHLLSVVERAVDRARDAAQPPKEPSAQKGDAPLFLSGFYESPSLRTEGSLRNASESGGFFACFFGEPTGTRAKLHLRGAGLPGALSLDVEVASFTSWGTTEGPPPTDSPGLQLRFLDSPGRTEFVNWLGGYRKDLEKKSVVVVVDDDPGQLEILSTVLRHAGLAVVTLDNPNVVQSAVAISQPALVILDYMMPGLDGGRLCQQLKADPKTQAIPVWLYSSVSEDHLALLAEQAGADGWMRKGTRPLELAERVRAAIESHKRAP